MRHADGHWVWVADTSLPVFDEQGEVSFFQGFLVDVSTRMRRRNGCARPRNASACSSSGYRRRWSTRTAGARHDDPGRERLRERARRPRSGVPRGVVVRRGRPLARGDAPRRCGSGAPAGAQSSESEPLLDGLPHHRPRTAGRSGSTRNRCSIPESTARPRIGKASSWTSANAGGDGTHPHGRGAVPSDRRAHARDHLSEAPTRDLHAGHVARLREPADRDDPGYPPRTMVRAGLLVERRPSRRRVRRCGRTRSARSPPATPTAASTGWSPPTAGWSGSTTRRS